MADWASFGNPNCANCCIDGLTCTPCIMPKSTLTLTWYYKSYVYETYNGCQGTPQSFTWKSATATLTWSDQPRYTGQNDAFGSPINVPANTWATPQGDGNWSSFQGDNVGCNYFTALLQCQNSRLLLGIGTSRRNGPIRRTEAYPDFDTCGCVYAPDTGQAPRPSGGPYGYNNYASPTNAAVFPSDCSQPILRYTDGTNLIATITSGGDSYGGSDSVQSMSFGSLEQIHDLRDREVPGYSPCEAPSTMQRQPLPKRELVVSHYREDLSWLNKIDIPKFVITKGGSNLSLDAPVVYSPNVGREAQTMLSHIVWNYHTLAETTYFVQGATHSYDLADRGQGKFSKPTTLTTQYKNNFPSDEIKALDKIEIVNGKACHYGAAAWHGGRTPQQNKRWLHSVWNYWFKSPQPSDWRFAYGAEIAVPRDAILSRPLEFWQQALVLATKATTNPKEWDSHPASAWAFELIWLYLLDPKYQLRARAKMKDCGCGKARPKVQRTKKGK